MEATIGVVVKIMVPFGVLCILRQLKISVPKRDHNFDNHPYTGCLSMMLQANSLRQAACSDGVFLLLYEIRLWGPYKKVLAFRGIY